MAQKKKSAPSISRFDHRRLGQKLGIFHISPQVGIGLPLWLPAGTLLKKILMDYLEKEQKKAGYEFVSTPHLGRLELYQISGHWQTYQKNMYQPIDIDGDKFILKPMNCPHHIAIYQASPKSYRDLPLRLAEYGTVYRYEQSGELMGLVRTRGFTIDDAHIFLEENTLEKEFERVLSLTQKVFQKFNFQNYSLRIGLKNNTEKYIGTPEMWHKAEKAIKNVVRQSGIRFSSAKGEAAFYGPKLDFLVKDNLGREWQLGTIQVDYNLPARFKLEYIDRQGKMRRPVMIHRAPFGSLERFIAILLEHYQGKLPIWLAPVQLAIIPVSDKFSKSAIELSHHLAPIRLIVDQANETVSKRVRRAKEQMIPYLLVYGEKEEKSARFTLINRENKKISLTAKEIVEKIETAN